jgi:hypothetical protein
MPGAFRFLLTAVTLCAAACGGQTPPSTTPQTTASADAGEEPAAPAGTKKKRLFVRETLADCTGEVPKKCMQVRESPADEWTFFYSTIEGFTYEENYAYELRVAVTDNPNPPADSSSLKYRLIDVVSKTKVTPPVK